MALQVGQLRQSALSVLFRGAGTAAREADAAPVEPATAAELLEGMSWSDVERLIARIFHREGFSVMPVNDRLGPADFVVQRGAEKIFVQCRHWNVWEVPDRAVRALAGYVAGAGSRGYMLSTGQFSDQARTFATSKGLELVDGASLPQLLAA